MLTIEVKRHDRGGAYFAPWIEDHEDGCTFHFHWDDISDEGTGVFRELFQEQARRWRPRPLGAPAGWHVPVVMERRTVMEDGALVAVDDHADYIAYTVWAELISERGAEHITRTQSERSPYWERTPARYGIQRQTV